MNDTPLNIKPENTRPLTGLNETVYGMPREQSLVLTGFRGTTLTSLDRYAFNILASVLSGENGRLYHSIRNELGI